MKQTVSKVSIYSADAFGVCSALYELGGLVIMHDASGCNSTYNTHDEPRWYDMDSMVYISGISEMEAIMGDDQKFIDDIIYTAKELEPKFIAIAGTPIPMMIGTDFKAIASVVEKETGIPTFGIATTGLNSYIDGIEKALLCLAKRVVKDDIEKIDDGKKRVNILGATPLDFSINKTVEAIKEFLEENGFEVVSTWAMGSTLEDIEKSKLADVNLVISSGAVEAAKYLKLKFNTPYVVGVPFGVELSKKIVEDLNKAVDEGQNKIAYEAREVSKDAEILIIGENIMSQSLAYAINKEKGKIAKVVSSVETDEGLLLDGDVIAMEEDEIMDLVKDAKNIIADPLYKSICKIESNFIGLPHEAFSGRIYRNDIPNIINKGL